MNGYAPILGILLVTALAASGSYADGQEEGKPLGARSVIESAFDRMFNYPSVRTVSLRVHRNGRLAARRVFDVAYRRIGDRGHTLVRFKEPEYLRGEAILVIETQDQGNHAWLYQSATRRIRRIGTEQKGDSFYGSDLTFEDLEHRDWDDFVLRFLPNISEQGRESYVIEATPKGGSDYSRLVAMIETDRLAILRIDFYRGRDDQPSKSLVVDPEDLDFAEGVLKPKRFWIHQRGRDAKTEVVFERIEVNAAVAESIFSSMQLERFGTDLYRMAEQLDEKEGTSN